MTLLGPRRRKSAPNFLAKVAPVITIVAGLGEEDERFLSSSWTEYEGDAGGMGTSEMFAIRATDETGKLIGAAKGWVAGGVGFMTELMVAAEVRRRGVGTMLLDAFESQCRERGHKRLALRTEEDGPARDFYRRCGWKVEFKITDWIDGRAYVQMRKDL